MSKTIEVSNETYEKIKDQLTQNQVEIKSSLEDLIGSSYFFRTVTYHLVGRVVGVFGHFLQLENCSWVADSGRFADALSTGVMTEIEPVGEAFVNMDSVTDFFPWAHPLPTDQK